MANIYELTNDFKEVMSLLESGEYDREMLENTLECIECEIEEKADGYARVIRNTEADIAAIKAEEERLAKKRKALENSVAQMKGNLEEAMRATGKVKFKTELFSFNIQKNPAKVCMVAGVDVPWMYLIEQAPKIDTALIKETLKSGVELPFAVLVQEESLRIR